MDTSCSPCLTQIPPDYCFANDNFNAVVTCSLCNCMDNESQREKDTFCQGGSDSNKEPANQDENAADAVTPCTSAQTFRGSTAVAEFSQCTDIDQVGMMVVDFDNDHFGALDSFELCAHSYHKDRDHGGRTAQSCMKILKNAVDAPLDDGHKGRHQGADRSGFCARQALVRGRRIIVFRALLRQTSNAPNVRHLKSSRLF